MLVLILAACATALATGLGALPVYALGGRIEAFRPALWGAVAGIMTVASIQGLILPGIKEGSDGLVALGAVTGLAFLLGARRLINQRHLELAQAERRVAVRGVLVFGVLFVHSLPEGLALGAAWASGTTGLGLFVFVAIALQNVPEGTAVAITSRETGLGVWRAFWSAVGTSAPQPVGAVVALMLVEAVNALLGFSFGFAAGAMLALVAIEVVPAAYAGAGRGRAAGGAVVGAATMFLLASILNVG